MLEGLDDIDWSKLEHAYGAASDVPEMIRELASPDAGTREGALYNLYGTIWHQGTVYSATAPAVPFLIELLESDEVEDKHQILFYLCHLAYGSSYLDVHQSLSLYEDERDDEEFRAQLEAELQWVRAAHEAVCQGSATYERLLASQDREVQVGAIAALAASSASEPLKARLAQEKDPLLLTLLLVGLAGLQEPVPADYLTHDDALVATAAALAHACSGAGVQPLAERLRDVERCAELDAILEREANGSFGSVVGIAGGLDEADRHALVEPFTANLAATTDPSTATTLASHLLGWAFHGEAISDVSTLTKPQRQVLEAVVHSDAAWVFNGNISYALGEAGMSGIFSRDDLYLFLGLEAPVRVMIVRPSDLDESAAICRELGREAWLDVPFMFASGDTSLLDEQIPEDLDDFPAQVMEEASQIAEPLFLRLVAAVDMQLGMFRFYPDMTPEAFEAICRENGWEIVDPPAEPLPPQDELLADASPDHDPGLLYDDLNEQQVALLDTFVQHLDEAGWNEVAHWHEFFQTSGLPVTPPGVAKRFGETADLEATLWLYDELSAQEDGEHEGDAYVRLVLSTKSGDEHVALRLYFGDRLAELLEVLTAHQGGLDVENYAHAFLHEAHEICDRLLLDMGDGQLFKLDPTSVH